MVLPEWEDYGFDSNHYAIVVGIDQNRLHLHMDGRSSLVL